MTHRYGLVLRNCAGDVRGKHCRNVVCRRRCVLLVGLKVAERICPCSCSARPIRSQGSPIWPSRRSGSVHSSAVEDGSPCGESTWRERTQKDSGDYSRYRMQLRCFPRLESDRPRGSIGFLLLLVQWLWCGLGTRRMLLFAGFVLFWVSVDWVEFRAC